MTHKLRIATRNSPLALWQARFVRDQLLFYHQNLKIEIIGMTTRGDQLLTSPLTKIGGKGLFVKELENALLNKTADIAIHSMKDVGVVLPDGLAIACIMARHNPFDALVTNNYKNFEELPDKAVIGTCSLRRICQLQKHYPNLQFKNLRGNINTRLSKLDNNEYDAIILAAAGLERLKMDNRITAIISDNICLPAIAQGTLGIECRLEDNSTIELISPLADKENTIITSAERSVNKRLNGSCQMPIAAYATINKKKIHLRAMIGDPYGSIVLYSEKIGQINQATAIGKQVADNLLCQGANKILSKLEN